MRWPSLVPIVIAVILLAPTVAHASDPYAVGQSCPQNGATAAPNQSGQSVICVSGVWGIGGGLWSVNGINYYYNTGNVGIGTTSPGAKLTVAGTVGAYANNAGNNEMFHLSSGTAVVS
jgi:hypothetical protein